MSLIGGGEILRGVMQKNCVWSRPAFYVIMGYDGYNVGTDGAQLTQTGQLQCHADRYFLMTAIAPSASTGGVGNGGAFALINQDENVNIYDAATSKNLILNPPMQISLYNDNLTSCLTLPDYVLWEPNSTIGMTWTGINHKTNLGYKFLTLIGIEYGMKNNGAS